MYTTILVPVDISEQELTEKALAHVKYLAKMSGAKVHFFHAMPDPSIFIPEMGYTMVTTTEEIKEKSKQAIEEFIKGLDIPAEQVTYTASFGTPRDRVLELADEIKADLIVIGSHRPSVSTYLLGSNASAIVRHAKIPVLVIR
ncbi:universal stress protein [Edaphovirga cremea]|uniref:universal stress protein n=1 Tax=Edaphovirga cremea TaxID=2267246 RepID=UPI000DEFCE32|nr:universal stress protein [Edaphovirga cremea]